MQDGVPESDTTQL